MAILGYLAAILVGVSLGLIGSGGSTLTVPVLTYLFGLEAVLATTYSLFIVGATSAAGAIQYYKQKNVDLKIVFFFGIPSILSVAFTRTYIVPSIPTEIFHISNFTLTKNMLLMVIFAALMLLSAISMLRKKSVKEKHPSKKLFYLKICGQGLFVGLVTGLVGAGGGFLIIPVLVNILHLKMKQAIGTSLCIITINTLSGFAFSLQQVKSEHWMLIFSIAAIAIVGILLGTFMAKKMDGKRLKPVFGWFILGMGAYILVKEIFF